MKQSYDARFRALERAPSPSPSAASGILDTDARMTVGKRPAPFEELEGAPPPAMLRGTSPARRADFPALNRSGSAPVFGRPARSAPIDLDPNLKPKYLICSILPKRMFRDEREKWGNDFVGKCPPDEGVKLTLNFGREDLNDKLFLNFESFEEALAYKRKYGKKGNEHLKIGETVLYLQFPRALREVVRRVFTKKTRRVC